MCLSAVCETRVAFAGVVGAVRETGIAFAGVNGPVLGGWSRALVSWVSSASVSRRALVLWVSCRAVLLEPSRSVSSVPHSGVTVGGRPVWYGCGHRVILRESSLLLTRNDLEAQR